jgi:AcrR family transcriptional regulator
MESIISRSAKTFAKKGYRASTLQDIANELGVTKPALYYYVNSKHQILWMIFEEILDIYVHSAKEILDQNLDPNTNLRALIEGHAMSVLDNKSFTTVFFREQPELSKEERDILKTRMRTYESIFVNVYRDGVRLGMFKPLNPHAVIMGMFGMINWLYQWFDEEGFSSKMDITNLYLQFLEQGYMKIE